MNVIMGLPPFDARPDQYLAIDSEWFHMDANRLHRPHGDFACAQIAFENGDVYVITDPHDIPELLRRIDKGRWVLANAMFDIRQLRRYTELSQRRLWDVILIERDLFGGYYSSFGLDSLSNRYLGEYMEKDVRDDFAKLSELTPETIQYAARDALSTLRVGLAQMSYVKANDVTLKHYWEADLPCAWAMEEAKPARINVDAWAALADDFQAQADEIEKEFDFNPRSPVQVKSAIEARYKTRIRDTQEETLNELIEKKPDLGLAQRVLEYRKYQKMASTYGHNWIEKYVEGDGYVYPEWKITGALTGRVSCSDPALQTVPSKKMPIFRTMFIPHPKEEIMVNDVAQQEPRILAKYSQDKKMLELIRSGISIHVGVGAELFGDPNFSKKSEQYPVAKALNLGLDYGLTASGLARQLGIPVKLAEQHVENYFRKFPGVSVYMDTQRSIAMRKGYVTTLLGRRCYVNPYVYKWKNNAINSPVQGTGADQMKMAVALVHQECKARGIPFSLMMMVHDENVSSHPKKMHKTYEKIITEAWNEVGRATLGDQIPLVLEFETGSNWGCKNG